MAYKTALRGYTAKRLEEIDRADIVVGIPCYNNQDTIAHVMQMVSHGLAKHYRDLRAVILLADGGSTDDSREMAKEFELKPWQEKLISIYRGPSGKGSALRSIFEASLRLNVKACAVVDSDLRSITGDWIKYLLDPVLDKGYQYVAPVYQRDKYDGTITNNIVYNLTRALYGKRIRQPIGGDFAFSRDLAGHYVQHEVWDSEVARFGIDVWMTTEAITGGFKLCQSNLGVKIHDAKDPGQHLGPMFRQVIWTLFTLMEEHEELWRKVQGSVSVPTFDHKLQAEPEPIKVNLDQLIAQFKLGFKQFGSLWKEVFCADCFARVRDIARLPKKRFYFPTEVWIQVLYELAATFHAWPANRMKLMDLVTPLYFGRVASFVIQTKDMTNAEAEEAVEDQARRFEEHKPYLIQVWGQEPQPAAKAAP